MCLNFLHSDLPDESALKLSNVVLNYGERIS